MKYFDANTGIGTVGEAVLKASLKGNFSSINKHPEGNFRYALAKAFGRRKTDTVCNYPFGFLYWGLSEYAIRKNCKELKHKLEQKSRAFLNTDGQLKYKLKIVDQTPMALYYINMYKMTNSNKYLHAAQTIADFIQERYEEDLVMYRKGGDVQLVDTLGLVIPFLIEFSSMTQNQIYTSIAKDIYDMFVQNSLDLTTGFPFHGYNVRTKQKLGSANWGRGLGWFLLASAYMDEKSSYQLNSVEVTKTQFINQNSMLDSSVALLTELYKIKTQNSYTPDWGTLNTFVRRDGQVDYCSGDTNGFNYYANHYGLGGLSNGLFLLILALK